MMFYARKQCTSSVHHCTERQLDEIDSIRSVYGDECEWNPGDVTGHIKLIVDDAEYIAHVAVPPGYPEVQKLIVDVSGLTDSLKRSFVLNGLSDHLEDLCLGSESEESIFATVERVRELIAEAPSVQLEQPHDVREDASDADELINSDVVCFPIAIDENSAEQIRQSLIGHYKFSSFDGGNHFFMCKVPNSCDSKLDGFCITVHLTDTLNISVELSHGAEEDAEGWSMALLDWAVLEVPQRTSASTLADIAGAIWDYAQVKQEEPPLLDEDITRIGYDAYIHRLQQGETVSFREGGNSMVPIIYSRDCCTYAPVFTHDDVKKKDAVFCKVGGRITTHLVTKKLLFRAGENGAPDEYHYEISNNHGHVNGITTLDKIWGRVVKVTK